jgi:E3 ubiquitin-protein ligase ATL6/9/15/31/42/55
MYAAAVLAAASAAHVAVAQSPEPRDNPTVADVLSISVFMAVFFPVFVVLLAFACLRLFRAPDDDPQALDAASAPGAAAREGSTPPRSLRCRWCSSGR